MATVGKYGGDFVQIHSFPDALTRLQISTIVKCDLVKGLGAWAAISSRPLILSIYTPSRLTFYPRFEHVSVRILLIAWLFDRRGMVQLSRKHHSTLIERYGASSCM